jgi:hypothetical protein
VKRRIVEVNLDESWFGGCEWLEGVGVPESPPGSDPAIHAISQSNFHVGEAILEASDHLLEVLDMNTLSSQD